MKKQLEPETYQVEIKNMDQRGSGRAVHWRENELGNMKKLRLTIPQTLPGETVEVTVDRPDRKRWWTMPKAILNTSSERVDPPCPHFEKCGGCVWQHWDYNAQLNYKTESVKKALDASSINPELVEPALGMDEPWHYRNKMEFTFSIEGDMGLHEQGNFRGIIPLETCLIAGVPMVDASMIVSAWAKEYELPGYNKDDHTGLLRHLMVRQSFATGEIMLGLFATDSPDGELYDAVTELKQRITDGAPQVVSFMWFENTDWADRAQSEKSHILSGRDYIHDELAGYKFRLWYDTFFQTNPVQAEVLVEQALKLGNPGPDEKMIDLFCGVGTFSLPFAQRVKALAGIEIVESSIESAKRNASDNEILNTTFLAKDARTGIDQMLEEFGHPELLMLDPPRSGAGGKVMRRIGRAKPERIVYVSCNPESFAVDVQELMPFGYELQEVQPVDMFPHTFHVELVAVLHKSANSV